MKNIILLVAFLGFSSAAFAQSEANRFVNIQKAYDKCISLSNRTEAEVCLNSAQALYYQTDALDICLSISSEGMDQYAVRACFSRIKDRRYADTALNSIVECKKNLSSTDVLFSCLDNVNQIHNEEELEQKDLFNRYGYSQNYLLPEDVTVTISQEVVVEAGRDQGIIYRSQDGLFTCYANIKKNFVRDIDQQFPSKILKIKNAKVRGSDEFAQIQIQDDAHFNYIVCAGGKTLSPHNRQALTEYFKKGGIGLNFPPPQRVQ